ncbi:MAG: sigma-54 dependent transcriptional regulator [Mariprofundaceae bacterium]
MSHAPLYLFAFPDHYEADIRIQLGRLLPDTRVESYPEALVSIEPEVDAVIFVWDSLTVPGLVGRLFDWQPQANIIVMSEHGDAVRAADLMRMGVMDYRILPCPDEAMQIYVRKAGHQAELTRQAENHRVGSDVFVTQDIETRRLLDQIALIAPSQASVLVVGESGTGKERISRYIHQCSNRKNSAFVAINCAAIPEGVLEAELFGHEKGAFTGASQARPGKFEIAHNGTFLLDEITEMPLHLQAKLLRVLQEGEVDRLGGRKPVKVDVRIIATSNRDIAQSVADGKFRQDLFYRLNVVTIQLPPLRERLGDIAPLTDHFLERFSQMYGKPVPALGSNTLTALSSHNWPGNIRELENCMHRAFLMCIEGNILPEHLGLVQMPQLAGQQERGSGIRTGMSIRDMERALIEQTLEHVKGNRTEAANLLGISIRTLRNKLKDYESGTAFAVA